MERESDPLSKSEYETLAHTRLAIRRFCRSSALAARGVALTPQQHELLLVIRGCPGREWTTIAEVAAGLQLRHNSVVGLVNRCEQVGWVRRRPDPDDGRQTRVSLTEQGEAVLGRLGNHHRLELEFLQGLLHREALQLLDRLDPQ